MGAARQLGIRGLQWRASLFLAVSLCAVIALFSVVILRVLDRQAQREAAAHAGVLAETLRSGLNQAMSTGERALIERSLSEATRTPELLEIVIADAAGTVRFASDAALVGRALRGLAYGGLDAKQPWAVVRAGDRPEALYRAIPIPRAARCQSCHVGGGETLGTIGLAVSLASTREVHRLTRNLLLGLATLMVLVLFALNALFFSVNVRRPLDRLLERFGDVARGVAVAASADARPVRDEIDQLHARFDAMIGELRAVHAREIDAERELVVAQRDERYRETLEELNGQLNARVVELAEANERINRLALELEDRNLLLEKAVKNISALNRVGVALSSELDLDRLVQLLINISVKGLRVEVGTILLFDERREQLVLRASSGLPADVDPTLPVAPGESVSGAVVSNGQPLLISSVDGSQSIKKVSRFGFTRRSVLCVPIKLKERVLGTIELTNRRGGETFSLDDLEMLQSIANQAAVAIENANLYRDVQRSYLETVLALVQAVEEKDRYTRGHSERVTAFSVKLASAMHLTPRRVRMVEYAGALHDIGKIGIDLAIIHKRERLSDEEFAIVKNHPLIGERIVRPIGFLADALPAIAQHHERFDGLGYPLGIAGEQLTLEARILAVADAYDAMITERPYRSPLPKNAAIAELRRCAGTQFDPLVVEHFLELLHNDPEIHRLEVAVGT
jgi:HD-GYP domain-containing protein (c-di-GMP phosphodiesterase class II)